MKVAGIIQNSVVNGIGVRDVIFFQGCEHHCPGCHNPKTWNINGGEEMSIQRIAEMFKDSTHDITLSGGEPLLQYDEIIGLMGYMYNAQRKRFWIYTGFRYEEIPPRMLEVMSKYVDVLVDGRFEEHNKDLKLAFRGSSNQRLIDLPKSVAKGKVILWEE
jgi:anaerobic ribonucleoside-triphosphate reductase activating protein